MASPKTTSPSVDYPKTPKSGPPKIKAPKIEKVPTPER
jgi:hypothetical protein